MELIFEKSVNGRRGYQIPVSDVPAKGEIPENYQRKAPAEWPQVTELDVVRHFMHLAQRNFSLDANFYPLGSCTMKYNPRFTEAIAAHPGFARLHPLLPQLHNGENYVQGALAVLYDLERLCCEITGMDYFTLQPLAGAHGELTGVMMIAAYHKAKGNRKKYIVIPDSAHGTNPASAAIAGYQTITVPSDKNGMMDLEKLRSCLNPEVAGLMLTNPNTAGIFDTHIEKICQLVHDVDGLMYYDGANLNAVLGRFRPGDVGFDVIHLNLHKTFATPHGAGGPGAGPVGVKAKLEKFLPVSRVIKRPDGKYALNYDYPDSIGYIASFYGNFAVLLKAYAYILLLGEEGLRQASTHAVLNANYLMQRLKEHYELAYDRACMHEFVLSAARQANQGVHAIDIAKYLIEQGFHPPTVYFPLTVKEAIMIEPTETESKETMDKFVAVMIAAAKLCQQDPKAFAELPRTMGVSRPDEVKAARDIKTNFFATGSPSRAAKK